MNNIFFKNITALTQRNPELAKKLQQTQKLTLVQLNVIQNK